MANDAITYQLVQNSTYYVEYIFIISSVLVANGANINGQDEDGLTPLQKVLKYFVNTLSYFIFSWEF